MAGLWFSWRKRLCISRVEHAIHCDLPPVLSSLSSYIPIVVAVAKKCSTNMAGPQTTTPLLVAWFFRFFRLSHFLTFSVTVVRIFVQIIALLFFTGRWQCGRHIALSQPWLSRWPKNYRALSSARSNEKTIMNYHVEFEHVQTAW